MKKVIWEFSGRYTKTTKTEAAQIRFTPPRVAVLEVLYGSVGAWDAPDGLDIRVFSRGAFGGGDHTIVNIFHIDDHISLCFPNPDSLSSFGAKIPYNDINYPAMLFFQIDDMKQDYIVEITVRCYLSTYALPQKALTLRLTETIVNSNNIVAVKE